MQVSNYVSTLSDSKILVLKDENGLGAKDLLAAAITLAVDAWDYNQKHGECYVSEVGVVHIILKIVQYENVGLTCDGTMPFVSTGFDRLRILQRALQHLDVTDENLGPAASYVASFFEGKAGVLAARCAVLTSMAEISSGEGPPSTPTTAQAREAASKLLALCPGIMALPTAACELMYGRAAYLQALLLVRETLHDPAFGAEEATQVLSQLLHEGAKTAMNSGYPGGLRLVWTYHETEYLGAGHGVAGIFFTLLQLLPDVLRLEQAEEKEEKMSGNLSCGWIGEIRSSILALVDAQMHSGNLPRSTASSADHILSWSSGAPGFIALFLRAAAADELYLSSTSEQFTRDRQRLRDAAAHAGEITWQRGALCHGVGIFKGIAGCVYGLLFLAKSSIGNSDPRWLRRAQQLTIHATKNFDALETVLDMAPCNLWEGSAGLCCALFDILGDSHLANIPGYGS